MCKNYQFINAYMFKKEKSKPQVDQKVLSQELTHLCYIKALLELSGDRRANKKPFEQKISALKQVMMSMTSELGQIFLTRLQEARKMNLPSVKVDILQTNHLRLQLKLRMDKILSQEPLSKLVSQNQASLSIKERKLMEA